MPKIVFILPDESEVVADADCGDSAMRVAVAISLPGIDGDCGGACSCATCHVKVSPEWFQRVGASGETEADMLEFEDESNVSDLSRLSCQIVMTDELDGVRLHVVHS